MIDQQELQYRIQSYLCAGGLFNPEMMEHNKVRDLIMDCRDFISQASANCSAIAHDPVPGRSSDCPAEDS